MFVVLGAEALRLSPRFLLKCFGCVRCRYYKYNTVLRAQGYGKEVSAR